MCDLCEESDTEPGRFVCTGRCLTDEERKEADIRFDTTASDGQRKPDPDCELCGGCGKVKGTYDPGGPEDCPYCMADDPIIATVSEKLEKDVNVSGASQNPGIVKIDRD